MIWKKKGVELGKRLDIHEPIESLIFHHALLQKKV
jgi:hypothetical protein